MRIFQLSDSYVSMSVVSKGRSSSQQLNGVMRSISAHLLAHNLALIIGHVNRKSYRYRFTGVSLHMVRILAGNFSRAERIRQRRFISLEDAALSEKTQVRYYAALRKLLPVLEHLKHESFLDKDICNWIHHCWKTGESIATISDGLCGLHFFQPWTRRKIPHSWKLFQVWRRIEVPSRAPPLTMRLVRSLAAYEVTQDNIEMAALLLLGFTCLLRTGELLELAAHGILIRNNEGIVSLRNTKSGARHNAKEAIHFDDMITIETLRTLLQIRFRTSTSAGPLWTQPSSVFRARFKQLCDIFHLGPFKFRPYSLRRGGATHLFQTTHSMEAALLKGRWQSNHVARIYISDALSFLPKMTMSPESRTMLHSFYFVNPHAG